MTRMLPNVTTSSEDRMGQKLTERNKGISRLQFQINYRCMFLSPTTNVHSFRMDLPERNYFWGRCIARLYMWRFKVYSSLIPWKKDYPEKWRYGWRQTSMWNCREGYCRREAWACLVVPHQALLMCSCWMEFVRVIHLILGENFPFLVSDSHGRVGKSHKWKDIICYSFNSSSKAECVPHLRLFAVLNFDCSHKDRACTSSYGMDGIEPTSYSVIRTHNQKTIWIFPELSPSSRGQCTHVSVFPRNV